MKKPHYKEKWFQALVLLCLVMSMSIGLDSGIDLDTPRNESEKVGAELKESVAWIVGLVIMFFFYISYGFISILHWIYFQITEN